MIDIDDNSPTPTLEGRHNATSPALTVSEGPLAVGGVVRVSSAYPDGIQFRSGPERDLATLAILENGTRLLVLAASFRRPRAWVVPLWSVVGPQWPRRTLPMPLCSLRIAIYT